MKPALNWSFVSAQHRRIVDDGFHLVFFHQIHQFYFVSLVSHQLVQVGPRPSLGPGLDWLLWSPVGGLQSPAGLGLGLGGWVRALGAFVVIVRAVDVCPLPVSSLNETFLMPSHEKGCSRACWGSHDQTARPETKVKNASSFLSKVHLSVSVRFSLHQPPTSWTISLPGAPLRTVPPAPTPAEGSLEELPQQQRPSDDQMIRDDQMIIDGLQLSNRTLHAFLHLVLLSSRWF